MKPKFSYITPVNYNKPKPTNHLNKKDDMAQSEQSCLPYTPPKTPFGIDDFKKKLCEELCFEIKENTSSLEYYQKIFKTLQQYLDENKSDDNYENTSKDITIFAKNYVRELTQKGNINPKKELDILIDGVRQNMQADFLHHQKQTSYDQPHDKSYMARRDANIMEIENAIEKSFQEQIKKSWFERIFKNGKER